MPVPLKGTDSHCRCWQVGQNSFGGSASPPHCVQRMPVRRPARAASKKLFSVTTRSVTAQQADEYGGGVPAKGVDQADTRSVHLTCARFAS